MNPFKATVQAIVAIPGTIMVAVDRCLAVVASKEGAAMYDIMYSSLIDGSDPRRDLRWQRHAARLTRLEGAIELMGRLAAALPAWFLATHQRDLFRRHCPHCQSLVMLGDLDHSCH